MKFNKGETMEADKLAACLEEAGYTGALKLISEVLLPLAQQGGITLLEAARRYANQDAEQDTSAFQLFHALQRVPRQHLT